MLQIFFLQCSAVKKNEFAYIATSASRGRIYASTPYDAIKIGAHMHALVYVCGQICNKGLVVLSKICYSSHFFYSFIF